ncbi:MAG: alanine--tRNA ligase-related protein [Patescibacteria group bacterium]|nr:alanine--tRNA ligase-related protein [Patescibacteria group bacterium]
MSSKDIREKYIKFFTDRRHKEIAPAKLVPENDPSTLFTSSGMQPLVPYLLGQSHPAGKRLVDSQPSFRAEDIEEVGDNRHTTFFEMLGNWSLGDYFKKEQLPWIWEFLTKELELKPERLFVTVFGGDNNSQVVTPDGKTFELGLDADSVTEWSKLFEKEKIAPIVVDMTNPETSPLEISAGRIFQYGVSKNWWSRSGSPDKMPTGEIGGPDSEVFYDFGINLGLHEESPWKDQPCHPNCDCGRFLEIGNSVFIQYQKQADGNLKELDQKNVDFGGGLERLTAAAGDKPDICQTDLFKDIIKSIEGLIQAANVYGVKGPKDNFRIIADHIKGATFLIKDGVEPSNKLQGYILRRLLRRAAVEMHFLDGFKLKAMNKMSDLVEAVVETYQGTGYFEEVDINMIKKVIDEEMQRFEKTLEKGLKEIEKIDQIDGKKAFDLYQTFGFPYEVTEELFRQKGQEIDREQFRKEFEKHRELSRTASAGMFKGGLADHSETVTKYHTATHLLHQALRDVLGPQVFQKGSNITSERLRFDFSFDRKMTDEEIKQTEDILNKRIEEDLKVERKIVSPQEAKEIGAIGLFDEKYGNEVSIYGIGPGFALDPKAKDQRERAGYYSLEFCGGPHVEHIGIIGKIKITKEEAVSAGVRRIRAQIV